MDGADGAELLEELKDLHAEFARLPGIEGRIAEADAAYRLFRDNGLMLRRPTEEQRELRRRLGML